jgi:hypothetical protein
MESRYEVTSTIIREYLEAAEMTDDEFGRRLKKGDAAAAIIFVASRLAAEIHEAAAEVAAELGQN